MKSHDVGTKAPGTQTEPQTAPAAPNGEAASGLADELNLDDLIDYEPVPPRRVVTISIQYRWLGRGTPRPYVLDEDSAE